MSRTPVDRTKTAYAIGLKGGGLMAMAGLWETWRAPSSGERVRSFAIVTTVSVAVVSKKTRA